MGDASAGVRTRPSAGPRRTASSGWPLTVRTRTALRALTRHPLSFLRSRWPWRSLAYLLSSAVLGVTVVTGVTVVVSISFLGFVPLMVAAGPAAAGLLVLPVTGFERWRLRLVGLAPPARARLTSRDPGCMGRRPNLATRSAPPPKTRMRAMPESVTVRTPSP